MNNSGLNTSVGAGRANDQAPQTQQESGGSGGEQLTHNINDTQEMGPSTASPGNRQSASQSSQSKQSGSQAEAAGSAATAANRTMQDTRGNQAGSTGTGLGAAETGGNQEEYDMPKE
ncbi:MAG: hypothetical protein ACJ8HI_22260 [Massilia sp.]